MFYSPAKTGPGATSAHRLLYITVSRVETSTAPEYISIYLGYIRVNPIGSGSQKGKDEDNNPGRVLGLEEVGEGLRKDIYRDRLDCNVFPIRHIRHPFVSQDNGLCH